MTEQKHVHLIGICGTAMASLAGMLRQRGFRVSGSDAAAYPPMSVFLESLGITVRQPFGVKNLEPRPDLVVVGNAISRGNVELEHVLDEHIPLHSLPQILHDEFLRGKEVLVVAGTHGKTTTTSMLAWIFHTAGMQPSFLVGGIAENFSSSFQLGQGKHFILEGDEYDTAFFDKGPKFLHYFPNGLILTSVEFDHADIYKDLDAVETAFKRLVNLIPQRGRIVAFDTGESLARSLERAFCPVERYGAAAMALSGRRKSAAEKLDRAVNAELKPLKLDRARFSTEIASDPAAGIELLETAAGKGSMQAVWALHALHSDGIYHPRDATANANVQLPPSISASKSYRCADNTVVYVDWLSDGSARVKKSRGEVGTPVPADSPDLKGDSKSSSVTYKGQSCQV